MMARHEASQGSRASVGGKASAKARANIALAKYWGKCDLELNLPAVPSISMTLDRLVTETSVEFDPYLTRDEVRLDDRIARPSEARRVVALLDRVRAAANSTLRARVSSENRFPTAAGLASSASGFAALAGAATSALGLEWSEARLSRLARRSSASAARSIFGGFAELPAGTPGDDRLAARPLFDADYWDLRIVVAVAAEGEKAVGSTEGMERSRRSSPFYEAWIADAPRLAKRVRAGLRARDLEILGEAMEQSTLAFHACAIASNPGIVYWRPATLAALQTVRRLRDEAGLSVWATMDAGPHVKALCRAADRRKVQAALGRTEGVLRTLSARPGRGLEVRL
ncbi:MAG: diphosphomevalonate decarboxylase [Myxococcales bacterium]|nr:diphosphomevalonate decarboxylase [Myxococcales bacterium]